MYLEKIILSAELTKLPLLFYISRTFTYLFCPNFPKKIN